MSKLKQFLAAGVAFLVPLCAKATEGERQAVGVGVAKNIEVVSAPDSRRLQSRVWTTEGKSYLIHGTIPGIEGSTLTVGLGERNDVTYLCGGLPKSCVPLVK